MATMLSDRTRLAQGYFAEGDRYLRANYRIRRRAELAGEVLGPLTGKHIVDLGCGDGAVSASFAEARHITFVDSAADMVGRPRYDRAVCRRPSIARYGSDTLLLLEHHRSEGHDPARR